MARGYKQSGNPFTNRGSSITPSSIKPITTNISPIRQTSSEGLTTEQAQMIADRRAKLKAEHTPKETPRELRERLLAERKQRLLAESEKSTEEVVETPENTSTEVVSKKPKFTGSYEEHLAANRSKEPVDDGWTYVGGDQNTANTRYRDNWETTGISDQSVWDANEGNLQDQYDSFEDFTKEAQVWRDSQRETQDRSDWEEHWSISDWKPSYQRRYGSMEDWIGNTIAKVGDSESAAGWQEEFKNAPNQQEFLKWAEIHAPNFYEQFTGGSSGSTSGTRRGKTNFRSRGG